MARHDERDQTNGYEQLSLKDLLDARDQYHIHLMQHPNVVGTAVGRYRIRKSDPWPTARGPGKHGRKGKRTLDNSEIRPYSWPAILVFVEEWIAVSEFGGGGAYDPDQIVPKTLYLPDGRRVPVCVIEAPRESRTPSDPPLVRYPLNNIGGGNPVIADVQGVRHVATIGCLVNDGHKVYALTNRHVTGDEGEVVYSRLGGKLERIGVSSAKQATRIPFTDIYPGWSGHNVYVNLDVGLIDIDDLDRWTAKVGEIGEVGPLVNLSASSMSLALIGRAVRGYGAASKLMQGEIHALFYRYKSQAGFEYISDFFIGPRTARSGNHKRRSRQQKSVLTTRPGDSGTLWLLEPVPPPAKSAGTHAKKATAGYQPIAVQWGENLLASAGSSEPQSYVLATCLSTVCNLLGVDLVRGWNIDDPDTWGAVGHFSIAARAAAALSSKVPTLATLMKNNLTIISHDDETIRTSAFKGMGDDAFVPMADVPDFFWKHGKQGHSRGLEGPNHFADMDQKRPGDQIDLLALCKDQRNIDPDVWNRFYDSVTDLLSGEPIAQNHRGLLPFRVWQIFDEMVRFAKAGKMPEFVCAARVMAHYVGDACQPLHISYLHDGDPEQPIEKTVHHKNGTVEAVKQPLGMGVHTAYEDDMVNSHRAQILDGLDAVPKVTGSDQVANGFAAAVATVGLMRDTFNRLPPATIVDAFVQSGTGKQARIAAFWKSFGAKTIDCMKDGTHLLAALWESAWRAGGGEDTIHATRALKPTEAMGIVADANFLPSLSIAQIGAKLVRPAGAPPASALAPPASVIAPARRRRTPGVRKRAAASRRSDAAHGRKKRAKGTKRAAAKRNGKARRKRATR